MHRAGVYGYECPCGFWWMESIEGWNQQTDEDSGAQRESLFASGIEDRNLPYEKEEPMGWGKAYLCDQLIHLFSKFHFPPNYETICISCFIFIPAACGKSLTHLFLVEGLGDLKMCGVKKIHVYPRSEGDLGANEVGTGSEALYIKAGFKNNTDLPRRSKCEKDLVLE